ncbi:hypothetical protein BCR33DRAFT_535530 [Rhizoclosmatium globosum]|uniref:B box-type domain-containing protein n=1 Tax=Rhizoclosmatium globosum TaxID=329046 RepID=A0A1Y2BC94_9FUNG|nr:hypothetical protein BCR33DRAFT_535530 [Rhizoclosmatium globosum]|eukprot:ORY32448.1 hypothetical protein BCR33DRAFT_535530 [Rhizoclosmatium globosum]
MSKSLAAILDADGNAMEDESTVTFAEQMRLEDEAALRGGSGAVGSGFCIECEDQPAVVHCNECGDNYCEVCHASQHRKGSRRLHTHHKLSRPSTGPSTGPVSQVPCLDSQLKYRLTNQGNPRQVQAQAQPKWPRRQVLRRRHHF